MKKGISNEGNYNCDWDVLESDSNSDVSDFDDSNTDEDFEESYGYDDYNRPSDYM